MDISNLITQDDVVEAIWLQLAEYGVFIDNIDDEGHVWFTVPRHSDYRVRAMQFVPGVGVSAGDSDVEMAGEFLLAFANGFFEENGLVPHDGTSKEIPRRSRNEERRSEIIKGVILCFS